MKRLTHSGSGFVRALQMSSARMFAVVEGRLDRPFIDRILEQICSPKGIKHQVFAVKELPSGTGGKAALLSTFREFRKQDLLACVAFGKKMVCLFVADKDADDFTKKLLRSSHLIYSPTYDLEGHLFSCGDLMRAVADSCGITMEQARLLVPNPKIWLEYVASLWKEWIALCLVSQLHSVNCGCTFDRPSQINPDPLGPPDKKQLNTFKANLAAAIGIGAPALEAFYLKALRQVESSIGDGRPMRYFKGKWLNHLMQRHLEEQARIPDASISAIGERIHVSLIGQVAHSAACRCAAPYVSCATELAAGL